MSQRISFRLRKYKRGAHAMKKAELLAEYIFNRRIFLEHEIVQLQENVRYRPVSSVDCLELIIARERLAMFIEVTQDISALLKLKNGIPP